MPALEKFFSEADSLCRHMNKSKKKTVGNLESFRMSVIFMFLDSRIHHRKRYVEQVNF